MFLLSCLILSVWLTLRIRAPFEHSTGSFQVFIANIFVNESQHWGIRYIVVRIAVKVIKRTGFTCNAMI